jgi:DNA-binding transcriptional ArsR family regulator
MSHTVAFEALADPTRRRLFERLRDGPCSVNQLVEIASVSQPAVSQHLRVLKAAHLVQVQKQGRQRIYSLNPEGLSELRAYVDSFWDTVLDAFQKAADEASKKEKRK